MYVHVCLIRKPAERDDITELYLLGVQTMRSSDQICFIKLDVKTFLKIMEIILTHDNYFEASAVCDLNVLK